MSNKDASHVRVMVVAETQQQRLAFSDTVRNCGFNLVDCIARSSLDYHKIPKDIDIWLIDSQYDQELSSMIGRSGNDTLLVGFSQAPYLNETQLYNKWQRKLKRKLASMLDMPSLVEKKTFKRAERDWQYVVLLGASMGGPVAIKEFLDNLSPELPISLLLAHHFSSGMIHTLPRILTRHNDWRCQIVTISQRLQAGTCLIAPLDQQIVCDSNGRVILTEDLWTGEYKPSISDLLKNASDVYADQLISIIFSGMGNDGSHYLQQIQVNHSQVWAQDPDNCASASQPQAIIDTGFCNYVGTPKQLAQKLTEYVLEHSPKDGQIV